MIDLLYRKALRNEVSATMVVGRLPHRAAGQGHPHAPCNARTNKGAVLQVPCLASPPPREEEGAFRLRLHFLSVTKTKPSGT